MRPGLVGDSRLRSTQRAILSEGSTATLSAARTTPAPRAFGASAATPGARSTTTGELLGRARSPRPTSPGSVRSAPPEGASWQALAQEAADGRAVDDRRAAALRSPSSSWAGAELGAAGRPLSSPERRFGLERRPAGRSPDAGSLEALLLRARISDAEEPGLALALEEARRSVDESAYTLERWLARPRALGRPRDDAAEAELETARAQIEELTALNDELAALVPDSPAARRHAATSPRTPQPSLLSVPSSASALRARGPASPLRSPGRVARATSPGTPGSRHSVLSTATDPSAPRSELLARCLALESAVEEMDAELADALHARAELGAELSVAHGALAELEEGSAELLRALLGVEDGDRAAAGAGVGGAAGAGLVGGGFGGGGGCGWAGGDPAGGSGGLGGVSGGAASAAAGGTDATAALAASFGRPAADGCAQAEAAARGRAGDALGVAAAAQVGGGDVGGGSSSVHILHELRESVRATLQRGEGISRAALREAAQLARQQRAAATAELHAARSEGSELRAVSAELRRVAAARDAAAAERDAAISQLGAVAADADALRAHGNRTGADAASARELAAAKQREARSHASARAAETRALAIELAASESELTRALDERATAVAHAAERDLEMAVLRGALDAQRAEAREAVYKARQEAASGWERSTAELRSGARALVSHLDEARAQLAAVEEQRARAWEHSAQLRTHLKRRPRQMATEEGAGAGPYSPPPRSPAHELELERDALRAPSARTPSHPRTAPPPPTLRYSAPSQEEEEEAAEEAAEQAGWAAAAALAWGAHGTDAHVSLRHSAVTATEAELPSSPPYAQRARGSARGSPPVRASPAPARKDVMTLERGAARRVSAPTAADALLDVAAAEERWQHDAGRMLSATGGAPPLARSVPGTPAARAASGGEALRARLDSPYAGARSRAGPSTGTGSIGAGRSEGAHEIGGGAPPAGAFAPADRPPTPPSARLLREAQERVGAYRRASAA